MIYISDGSHSNLIADNVLVNVSSSEAVLITVGDCPCKYPHDAIVESNFRIIIFLIVCVCASEHEMHHSAYVYKQDIIV